MVKKLSAKTNEEIKEETLLDYLIRVTKPVTRLDMKKAGFLGDRKTLRELEKAGMITKTENFAKNTAKKDSKGNLLRGTKFYTYSINKIKEDK